MSVCIGIGSPFGDGNTCSPMVRLGLDDDSRQETPRLFGRNHLLYHVLVKFQAGEGQIKQWRKPRHGRPDIVNRCPVSETAHSFQRREEKRREIVPKRRLNFLVAYFFQGGFPQQRMRTSATPCACLA